MSDDTDLLLDRLSGDLKPAPPLRAWPMWLSALAGSVLAALFILYVYGPRPEMAALAHGEWPAEFVVIGKPLLFLATGLCALSAVAGLVRPEGRAKWRSLAPVAVLLAIVLITLVLQFMHQGPGQVMNSLVGGDMPCFLTILIGGMIGLAGLWAVWLRKAATSHPVTLGGLSGLATGSLMAAAYALHCNMDAPIYIVVIYGFSVALFTAVAALLGSRFLRW